MTIQGDNLQRHVGAHLESDAIMPVCDASAANAPGACGEHPTTFAACLAALTLSRLFGTFPIEERIAEAGRQEVAGFPICDCPYRLHPDFDALRAGRSFCASAHMFSALRAEARARLIAARRRVQANAQVVKAASASLAALPGTAAPQSGTLGTAAPQSGTLLDANRPTSLDPVLRAAVHTHVLRPGAVRSGTGYLTPAERDMQAIERGRQRERDRVRLLPHAPRRGRGY